jgi:hypothetical protein
MNKHKKKHKSKAQAKLTLEAMRVANDLRRASLSRDAGWANQSFSPSTREDIEADSCGDPNCPCILLLQAYCHPDAPMWVHYDKRTGTLRMTCSVCERPIDSFVMAHNARWYREQAELERLAKLGGQ